MQSTTKTRGLSSVTDTNIRNQVPNKCSKAQGFTQVIPVQTGAVQLRFTFDAIRLN